MSPILSSDGAAGRSLCCQRHIPWWATVALAVAGSLVLPKQALDILLALDSIFCGCVLASLLPFLSPPLLSFFFCLPRSSTRVCFYGGRTRSRDPSL
ncbi:hypothetical protein B0H14DRAFT_2803045, partial [Mycena olivaceomarginata]